MAKRKRISWPAIQIEYEAGVLSVKELIDRYGISSSGLFKRAKAEGWKRTVVEAAEGVAAKKISKRIAGGKRVSASGPTPPDAHEKGSKSGESGDGSGVRDEVSGVEPPSESGLRVFGGPGLKYSPEEHARLVEGLSELILETTMRQLDRASDLETAVDRGIKNLLEFLALDGEIDQTTDEHAKRVMANIHRLLLGKNDGIPALLSALTGAAERIQKMQRSALGQENRMKHTVTGPKGGPVEVVTESIITEKPDYSVFDPDELFQLRALVEKVERRQSSPDMKDITPK